MVFLRLLISPNASEVPTRRLTGKGRWHGLAFGPMEQSITSSSRALSLKLSQAGCYKSGRSGGCQASVRPRFDGLLSDAWFSS